MKEMKRILALVLCFVMLVGLMPATAFAAVGAPTIVIAGSDYQNTNGGLFSDATATDAYAILSQIKEDYSSAYGFLFGGDYYAHGTNTTTESTNGKNQLKEKIVDVLYPDMADETQIYIQGNHDADVLTTNGTLATSGAHDTDYYGVYVINEKDYMWYNNDQTTIQNTAAALKSYLDEKQEAGYTKPIFVLSHLPLHFSTRTVNEGDGKYAKYIYDVLDEAGANDLNIIFMYGHNHSTSYYEAYLGNAAVYLPKDDTIYVANEGSQSSCFSDTLNFTYMNYGFTGYLSNSTADGALTMTVFEIYEDEVKVKRYDASGAHNLKSTGVAANMPSGVTVNTNFIGTDGASITLTIPEEMATFTDNGVTVTAAGITAVTASKAEAPTYNSSLYSGYEEYTVSAEGYEAGRTATVTIALTEGDFDTTRSVIVKFPNGHTEEVAVVNGAVTVKTDELGTFTLMQKVQTEIEIPGGSGDVGTATERTYTRVDSVSDLVSGGQYLFFFESGQDDAGINGPAIMTPEEYTYNSRTGMKYAASPVTYGGETVTGDLESYEFTMESSGSGWLIKATDGYLAYTEYSSYDDTKKALTFESTGTVFTITGSSGSYNIYSYFDGSDTYFDENSRGMVSGYTYANGTVANFYIYRLTATASGGSSVDTEGGDWITITEPTGGNIKYVLDTDGVNANTKYLIVNTSSNGTAYVLTNNGNGGVTRTEVTISNSAITVSDDTAINWIFSGSESGTVVNQGGYIYLDRYTNLSLTESGTDATFSHQGNGAYRIYRYSNSRYNYLRYNNNSWSKASTSKQNSMGTVYLFAYDSVSGGTNGLYGKLEGELTYTVPYGTTQAVALAKVKEGITIKYATAADYSDEATFNDDGEGMTWEVVNYDGETAGEYAVNIYYTPTGGSAVLLGTAKIVVNPAPAGTAQVTIDSDSGIVRQNAGVAALTGNKLTITYDDGTTETVNVTLAMVKNADGTAVDTSTAGTKTGLKVVYTYNGVEYTICNNYTLTVRENVQNNYPEYPDEGAVKVSKTATGVEFQSTGIAQVEIATSGVPAKKGVDVIVMVDTSSSMTYCVSTDHAPVKNCSTCGTSKLRITYLKVALENLVKEFQAVGDDGEQLDIKVAIADFNGYSAINANCKLDGVGVNGTTGESDKVFTGSLNNPADAFVDASALNATTIINALTTASGTNYDDAMETVYRLGAAINAENAQNGEERDLFVIFMSDGAPYQYNYINGGTYTNWNYYLLGTLAEQNLTGILPEDYAHFYNEDGDHWLSEAVKGSTGTWYDVIDGGNLAKDDNVTTQTSNKGDYFVQIQGLGAEMHVIGFCLANDDVGNGTVLESTQHAVLQNMASVDSQGNTLYHETQSGTDLNDIFCDIASQIAYAATNARFVDQMGENFNLQMTPFVDYNGNGVDTNGDGVTDTPAIEIITYDIYTRQDFINGLCTEKQIGVRKGTYTVNEVVRFSNDGTKAYSNKIDVDGDGIFGWTETTENGAITYNFDEGDNIMDANGVIYAKSFLYNSSTTADATITGVDIPTGTTSTNLTTGTTSVLPQETFYWKLGTVTTSELAMRYYVYLEGSMEGLRDAGSYPTNNYANLYYDNYLGNACHKDTVSPTMAWESANVSYAFYLVNENGEIITNQSTGATGTFANKIAVTNPVVYEYILLNNEDEISSIEVESLGVLPEGYELYDKGAVYTIEINSDATGSWTITNGGKPVDSTYVTNYSMTEPYTNELTKNSGADFTKTVVWFAVLWKVQALPDSVVIDYGLPVDIAVLSNDMFGEAGKLAGVGAYYLKDADGNVVGNNEALLSGSHSELDPAFGESYTGTYGVATADVSTGKVRYTLNESNGMQMNTYEKFAYAVEYTGTTNPGFYYDTVTVIPATTIYYEDNFVTTRSFTWDYTNTNTWAEVTAENDNWVWTQIGTVNGVQDEDRPGQYALSDANNIYGYDSVNLDMSTHSMGNALMATVDYDNYGTVSFTFWGTGFDVISMTSNTTGMIFVDVERLDATADTLTYAVDTYYGYKQEAGDADGDGTVEDGELVWVVDPNADDCLWQIPVIKVEDLTYGQYQVTIEASYESIFNHVAGSDSYEFYLDAIRIYDPANDGTADGTGEGADNTIEDAYKADGEGWPSYFELRNALISAGTLGNAATDTQITGLVFIDGDAEVGDAQIADYISFGPNNEVYLKPGQRVAFLLSDVKGADGKSIVDSIHIGIKSADGATGTYTITNIARNDIVDTDGNTKVKAGTYYGAKTYTIGTTTDMYYDLTGWKGDIIVISNTGNREENGTTGIISLTNIKATYTANPNDTVVDVVVEDESGVSTASTGDLSRGISVAGTTKQSGDVSVLSTASETENTETVETVSNEVYAYMTPAAATLTLRALNTPAEDETPEETEPTEPETSIPEETEPETSIPEETEPETSIPEETEPETSIPEETEPETSIPEETEPETTVPEETEPSVEETVKEIVKEIIKAIGGWFGKWF